MACLKLFGGAFLETENGLLSGPAAQRHRLALLALLAVSQPRTVPREKLTAWLWPERDTDHARNLLNQAVYVIRKSLGEDAILAMRDGLRWNAAALRCDAVDFEQCMAAGELEGAVALHSGPFLDGFFLSDAGDFERWAAGERERYARLFSRALAGLAETSATAGDAAAAAEWWLQLAGHEPYNSRVTLRLMESLAAAGDHSRALRQARLYAERVAAELGAEPDPAVSALAGRLRREPFSFAPDDRSSVSAQPSEDTTATAGGAGTAVVSRTGERSDLAPPESVAPGQPPAAAAIHPRSAPWRRLAVAIAAAVVVAAVFLPRSGGQDSLRPTATADAATVPDPGTIAVLACTNGSGDPEEEYFSDGVAEELIGVLSRVQGLRVVARTSAFAFKNSDQDVREIGRALHVRNILECSVQRENNRVRVTANLVDAGDGFSLWSHVYEREGADLFAIRADLALRVAAALHTELNASDRARLTRPATAAPDAYLLYLKGRYFWNQRTAGALLRAIEHFERAVQVDRGFAAAYAGLANAYGPLGLYGYQLTPEQARSLMREAALKAAQLDDGLADAHAALAAYLNLYAWDRAAAEKEYLRAIESDPGYGTPRMWYSYFLEANGRFEESVRHATLVVQLDPLSPLAHAHLGRSLNLAGRTDVALRHLNDALELDSTFWITHMYLGEVNESVGRFEQALQAYRTAAQYAGTNPVPRAQLARTLVSLGRGEEARSLITALKQEGSEAGVYSPAVATALWAIGDKDAALAWLAEAARQRHPAFPHLLAEPAFAALRSEPQVAGLLRRAGLI